jgi:hypothetical protein
MRRCFALGAVAVVILGLGGALIVRAQGGTGMPALPRLGAAHIAYHGDVGDPFVIRSGGGYVVFGTDDWPDHVPTATSPDLLTWTTAADALPVRPAWAGPDPDNSLTWAPAVVQVGARFVLYIALPDAASGRQCIGATVSSAVDGPYRDGRGSPLICQTGLGGSIDPTVVSDRGLHLVWKSDGAPGELWEQDLAPSGLAVTGHPHRLLTADRPWQAGIVENPAMISAAGGGWWLFYSGNRFDRAAYATGLAWCRSLQGPCREATTGPFLSGTAVGFSPGGVDFFRASDGEVWAAFATWSRPSRGGQFFRCRQLDIAPVLSR